MDLNYSSEETDRSSSLDELGTGRSYECFFCKRGFTTAQALGGHMNIHRKERANKTKPSNFPPPSTTSNNNHSDLGFYSQIPSHLLGGTAPSYRHDQVYFPATACGVKPSHVLSVENKRDHLFAQDWWNRNLSLYTNPLCVDEIKDKFEDTEDHGIDLELRLGHHP